MLTWARKHIPEALLIPAGVSAGAVTVLSDINEVVPWGHEFGIGVSQLAFAYVGAYIFNWLIVERPKARALRQYYWASWPDLVRLLEIPDELMAEVARLAHSSWLEGEVISLDSFKHWFMSAQLVNEKDPDPNFPFFPFLADRHRTAYNRVMPHLDNYEPAIAVALDRFHSLADEAYRYLESWPRESKPYALLDFMVRDVFVYYQQGRVLAQALKESQFTPSSVPELSPF